MAEPEVVPDIDPAELKTLLRQVRQGDLLDIAKVVFLYSPDAPSHPSEVEGVPHVEPMITQEMQLESGRCVIVSQDCDIRQMPNVEPHVMVCPLREVDDKMFKEATDGVSARYFAYPPIDEYEHLRLVVDGRTIQSIEKTALLSPHLKRIQCPLSEARRTDLRIWLGQRLGRDAYPDEILRQIVRPIERAVKRAREQDVEGVFGTIVWMGLRWTPGKSYSSLLLLTDPARRAKANVDKPQLELMLKRLRAALGHFFKKAGSDYMLFANVHDATEIPAAVLLEHYELSLDLDPIDLEAEAAAEAAGTERPTAQ